MKKFSFSLDAILSLREFESQKAFSGYQTILIQRQRLEEIKEETIAEAQKCRVEILNNRSADFTGYYQRNFAFFLQDMEERVRNISQTIQNTLELEKKAFQIFLNAKRKADALLKLKEKKKKAHADAEFKKEEKEIEDIINSRFISTL